MGEKRARVLVLGGGPAMERAASGLVAQGIAVSHVVKAADAQRLMGKGGFDVVLADGTRDEPGAGLFRPGGRTPWLVLVPEGQAAHAAYEGAEMLTLPLTPGRMAEAVLRAAGRKPPAPAPGRQPEGVPAVPAAGPERPRPRA